METYGFYDQTLFHIQSLQILCFHSTTYYIDIVTVMYSFPFLNMLSNISIYTECITQYLLMIISHFFKSCQILKNWD